MDDLIKVKLAAQLDVEKVVSQINAQTKEISDKMKPIEVKSTSSEVESIKREYSEIGKVLNAVQSSTQKVYDGTGNLTKAVSRATDDYGRQLEIIKTINSETGMLEVSQEKITHNTKQMADQLARFQDAQILKIDKHTSKAGLSSEMEKLKQSIQELTIQTPNVQKLQNALKDDVSRTIHAESEAIRIRNKELRDTERVQESLRKYQNTQLLRIDKHTGDSPTDEMRALRDMVSGLSDETENLSAKKDGLRDAISRVIDIEKEEIKVQRELNKEMSDAEKAQSKALWGMSKDMMSDRHGTSDGLKQLNDWYAGLEKVDNKLTKFKANYGQKIKELTDSFGETEGIKKLTEDIGKLTAETPNATQKMDELKLKFKEVKANAEEGSGGIQKITQSFGSMAKQALSFAGIHLSIYGAMNAVKDGISTINDMNASLTEIGMVTNRSVDSIGHLAREYNNLAKEMNVSTNEVMDGVVAFTRQGLEQEQVMERLRGTTMFSKITNLDFGKSIEYLTATVNAMNIDVERATDTFIYLGDSTATSGAEVAEGFNAISGTANAMNLEFEKVSSWIAGISARTRESASSIGRSLNMIVSRMGRLTATGFDEEDGTKINDVAKALDKVGISLTTEEGNFRNFADVIDELAVKWGTLDEKTQIYLGNALAGARHQSRFFNLMEAYPDTIELYEGALDAAGTTQEKFGIYTESTQAKLDTLKATIEELWLSLLDSGAINNIIEGATKFINVLVVLVDKLGGLGLALPLLGLAAGKVGLEFKLLGDSASASTRALAKIVQGLFITDVTAKGAAASMTAFNIAAGGLAVVLGVATFALSRHAAKQREMREQLLGHAEAYAETTSKINEMREAANKLDELSRKEANNTETKKEMLSVQKDIAAQYPELTSRINEEGEAIADNTDKIREYIDANIEMASAKINADATNAQFFKENAERDMQRAKTNIEEISKAMDESSDKDSKNFARKSQALSEEIKRYQELKIEIQTYDNIISEASAKEMELVEAKRWSTAETIAQKSATASSIGELQSYEEQLVSVGFSHSEASSIVSGGLEEVRQKTDLLTDAQLDQILSTTDLESATTIASANKLSADVEFTSAAIDNAKTRISAYIQEMNVLAELHGAAGEAIKFAKSGAAGPMPMDILELAPEEQAKVNEMRTRINEEMRMVNELEDAKTRAEKALEHIGSLKPSGSGGVKGGGSDSSKRGGGGSKGSGSKGSKQTVKEYEAQQDAVSALERELKQLEFTTSRYDKLIANTRDSEKRNKNIEKTIELYNKQQKTLNLMNNEMRKNRQDIANNLESKGIASVDKATGLLNVNLSKYNNISDENKEAIDKQIQEFDKLTDSINSNSLKWFDLQKNIREANVQLIELQTAEVEDALKYLDFDLDGIGNSMAKLSKEGKEYWEIQKEELKLLSEKRTILQELLEDRERDYHRLDLSLEQHEQLEDKILDIRKAIRSVNEEMYSVGDSNKQYLSSVADNVIQMYKDVYSKQKEAALKALDEEMKLEDERHKQAMEHYDKEQKKIDELIKAKIDELDKRVDEEKYANKLQKEQEERQRILNEINKYGMDDSLEGKQKVSKLTEELEKQDEKIANMKYDRDVSLRKKNLQDQLNNSKKEITDNKDKENEKYDQLKERYDKEKIDIEEHYDFIINNEREYAAIRENIMAGHFDQVYADFTGFVDQFANDSVYLGDVIAMNITDRLEEITGVIEVLSSMRIDTDGNASVKLNRGTSNVRKKQQQSQKELINNIVWLKGKWEDADKRGDSDGKAWAKNKAQVYYADLDSDYAALLDKMNYDESYEWYKSGQWEKVKASPKQRDNSQSARLYDKWLDDNVVKNQEQKGKDYSNFTGAISQVLNYKRDWDKYDKEYKQTGSSNAKYMRDSSSDQVKNVYRQMPPELARILQSMNYQQAVKWFNDGKYRNVYHTGGIVGGSGNKLTELLNQLSNQRNSASSNERIIKALNNELMIPEFNVSDKLAPNLREGLSGGSSSSNVVNIEKLIDISEFNNKSDVDIKTLTKEAWDATFKELGGRGFKFNR